MKRNEGALRPFSAAALLLVLFRGNKGGGKLKSQTTEYDANGKVITKNVLGRRQAEVKDKLRTAIEDSKKLDPVKAGSYTLEQWLKLWYSIYVEPQVRYSTREFYHNAIDHHIIPKLGSVKLEKLTMLQIQQFYSELLKNGRVQKKNQPELKEHGLSPRMVQCVHVVLNKALEHAVEEKLILANPAKKCKIPKNTRKEMNILPEALIGPYLSAAKEHGILAPMYLELTTGLRRGRADAVGNTGTFQCGIYAQHLCPLDAGDETERGRCDRKHHPQRDLS